MDNRPPFDFKVEHEAPTKLLTGFATKYQTGSKQRDL
jgi:hypothetical protein